jgi:hypothetical protein
MRQIRRLKRLKILGAITVASVINLACTTTSDVKSESSQYSIKVCELGSPLLNQTLATLATRNGRTIRETQKSAGPINWSIKSVLYESGLLASIAIPDKSTGLEPVIVDLTINQLGTDTGALVSIGDSSQKLTEIFGHPQIMNTSISYGCDMLSLKAEISPANKITKIVWSGLFN